ncbi:MAG: hypothetical protein ACRD47_07010 [Nitrososphaeraceae archaeon]
MTLILIISSTSALQVVLGKDYDTRTAEGSSTASPPSDSNRDKMTGSAALTENGVTSVGTTPGSSGNRSLEQTTIPLPTMKTGGISSPSTMGLDGDFSAQAALQIPRTLQSADIVNSLAFYEVTFITSTAGAIDKIEIQFPAGTNIAAAGVIERVGIGGGALTKAGSTLTYDLTTPVNITAGTFIRLEMFGIKNPGVPSTTYTATITTRDSGGAVIDGPSQTNVYTMRQIGTTDIVPGAIRQTRVQRASTLFDIAPGSSLTITSPPCLAPEDIQGGGYGTTNTNGLVNIVAEFSVDTNADPDIFLDGWQIVAHNLDTVNTWAVQSIAECGIPGP